MKPKMSRLQVWADHGGTGEVHWFDPTGLPGHVPSADGDDTHTSSQAYAWN